MTLPPTAQLRPAPVRRRRRDWPLLVPAGVLGVFVLMALWPSLFKTVGPRACTLSRSLQGPQPGHPFGFSVFGCDYLSETVYGARGSLSIAALTVVGTLLIGVLLGSVAGFYGGWVDTVVSRVTDVWTAIPLLLGGVVLLSALQVRGVVPVSLVLVLFGWPAMVRLQRASVLQAAGQEYVAAARALGAPPRRVLWRHVLPNAVRPLTGYAMSYAGLVIGVEATLTFVGVGLQLPALSWGIQLFQAQNRLLSAPHLLVFPALFLVLAVGSLVLLGRAVGRTVDPLS